MANKPMAKRQTKKEQVRDERWPKDGSHLSLQLQSFKECLAQIGISYTRDRNRLQRTHVLSCQDA